MDSGVIKKTLLMVVIAVMCAVVVVHLNLSGRVPVIVELSQPKLLGEADNNNKSLEDNVRRHLGYVLVGVFGEQIESAMYDLYQLADLAESWGMKVVEPTVHTSKFYFPLSEDYHWILGNLFDMKQLNRDLMKHFNIDYNLIIPSQDILKYKKLGSYKVVLVHWTSSVILSNRKCAKLAHSFMASHMGKKTYKKLSQLTLIVTCLQRSQKINFRTLLNHSTLRHDALDIIKEGNSKFLVLFTSWNGIRTKPGSFFYFNPDFNQRNYGSSPHSVRHSKEVVDAAEELKTIMKLKSPFIGVHVRLERLIRSKLSYFNLTRCITSLVLAVRQLKFKYSIHKLIIFTDYTAKGSATCRHAHCTSIAKQLRVDKHLKELGIVNPILSNKSSSLRKETGFISNVEQELLSQADFLALLGFGSFQDGIISRHARYHNVSSKSLKDYTKISRVCNFRVHKILEDRTHENIEIPLLGHSPIHVENVNYAMCGERQGKVLYTRLLQLQLRLACSFISLTTYQYRAFSDHFNTQYQSQQHV